MFILNPVRAVKGCHTYCRHTGVSVQGQFNRDENSWYVHSGQGFLGGYGGVDEQGYTVPGNLGRDYHVVTLETGNSLVVSGVEGGTGAVLLQRKGVGEGAESAEEVA